VRPGDLPQVERGELSLDDDVREHIPELPDLGETVTVRNLLSHTSGYREFLNLLTMTGRRLEHIVEGRAAGYAPAEGGTFRELRDFWGAVGAGTIYSTVGDLQKWVENYADPYVGSAETVQEMMTPYVLADGEPTEYGLGLFIDEQRGLKRIHHGGAHIAHRWMLAYYPEIGGGITTQSNHAGFDSNLAFRLAEAFFADAMEPEEDEAATASDFDPATYDPEDFDEFVGRYALDAAPDFILTFSREVETFYTVTLEEDHLVLQQRRRDDADLDPGMTDNFSGAGLQVSFERDRNGQVIALYLANGRTRGVRFERVD